MTSHNSCFKLLMISIIWGCCFFSSAVFADDKQPNVIKQIIFKGNRITRETVLRQELPFSEGAELDKEKVEDGRQAIMSLGLFQDVEAEVKIENDSARVIYRVKEKYYFYPLPRFSRNSDGDIRYGAELRWDNLLGLNQRLRFIGELEEAASDISRKRSRRLRLRYDIPRIPGTDWGLNLSLQNDVSAESASDDGLIDEHDQDSREINLTVSRWLTEGSANRGWRISLGFLREERRHSGGYPEARVPEDGVDSALTAGLTNRQVLDKGTHREGFEYGAEAQAGGKWLGGSSDRQQVNFFHRAYRPLETSGSVPSNFNYQVRFGIAGGRAFGGQPFSLGGSGSLRGYTRNYRHGNLFLLLNTEYLRPLFNTRWLRGVVFADLGGAWKERRIKADHLHFGTGAGLRIHVRWLVETDLRLDCAYGVDSGDIRFYAGTSHTF